MAATIGAAVREITLHDDEIAGLPVRWRQAGDEPILWLHRVPNASEMWAPFQARAGGIAVDLPGFGRSGKPASFDYTIAGYGRFLTAFLDHLGLERVRLGMHDWGAVGLAFAQTHPERVERILALDVVPFLPGYRWHRWARMWRRPVLGELTMGFTSPRTLRAATDLPPAMIAEVAEHFDHGTQRAILKLYRSASPEVLAGAGVGLRELDAPALVLWGDRDPYLPSRLAGELAQALPRGRAELVPEAGHWPWIDRPEVIDRVVGFLSE